MSYQLINAYCTPKPFVVVGGDELTMEWTERNASSAAPDIFGPPVWFTLHNGAAHLPQDISPISMSRIRGFIDGIPDMVVACTACSEHARAFIENNKSRINSMKTGDDVFNFYVDFHNYVNQRLGKPLMSHADARKLYNGKSTKVFNYR
jgi:hypothetical protein